MHGNVWEWCHDFYDETYYRGSPRVDPPGPSSGKQRVLRGGAWNSTADACRAAHRFQEFPVFTDACFGADSYGFRRVRRASRDAPASAEQRRETSPAEKRENRAAAEPAAEQAEPEKADPAAAPLPAADGPIDTARLTGTVVFVSDRGGSLDIWTMRANGTQCRQLTNDEHPDADPRFSPDGQRILYTSLREGFPELWIMNRDGSAPQRVTEGCQPAWHPDGHSIVFIRDDQAYVRELESGYERRVTAATWKRCGVPAWSPDGTQIAVASRHLGRIGIFLLDAQGQGDPKQLASEDPCCTPQWSPDGQRMLFQTIKGHIHEMDLADGTEEQLTFGADVQHDPRYSPDGQLVIFARGPTQQGPWQLCVVDLRSDDLDVMQIAGAGSNRLPDWHRSDRSEEGP
jgi:TolB protein